MINGIVYDKATGEIVMSVISSDEAGVHIQTYGRESSVSSMICETKYCGSEYYVSAGEITPRPEFPALFSQSDDIEVGQVWTATNVPTGTTLIHPGGSVELNDGSLEWSAVEPGEYVLTFIRFPMKVVRKTITAS